MYRRLSFRFHGRFRFRLRLRRPCLILCYRLHLCLCNLGLRRARQMCPQRRLRMQLFSGRLEIRRAAAILLLRVCHLRSWCRSPRWLGRQGKVSVSNRGDGVSNLMDHSQLGRGP